MSKIQHFTANTKGKDLICGDIHGCWDALEAQLAYFKFDKENDRLFCVGDLCDRGPDSIKALEYLAQPWFHTVMGNHEELLCNAVDETNAERDYWMQVLVQNGGGWIDSITDQAAECFADAFRKLPYAIDIELPNGKKVGLVHAEVIGVSWQELVAELVLTDDNMCESRNNEFLRMLTWGREKIQRSNANTPIEGIDHIFHGHTIVNEIYTKGNCSYIDTGCFTTGSIMVVDPTNYV